MRWQLAVVCVLAALSLAAPGCAGSSYLQLRPVPRNPLAGPLELLSRSGPKPTSRTVQMLRRYDLAEVQRNDPEKVLERLQRELTVEPSSEKVYAFAELAYVLGRKAEAKQQSDLALDLYGASVAHAYLYLLDPHFDQFRNPYDPQFRGACDLYNGALESAMRLTRHNGQLVPGQTQVFEVGGDRYEVSIVLRGSWRAEEIERLEFVSDYEVTGLKNRHHTYGLGVPLIAVRKPVSETHPAAQYYPPGLSFPITAFLRVMPEPHLASTSDAAVHRCVLELYDPLEASDIHVAGRRVPLETDLSTPLAYFLDNPAFKENASQIATWGLLNPSSTQQAKGLYMLAPYDPQKIPVLMIHGLWSSPLTWMEMFNDLQAFPEIRDRYQFWFYLYPTGQPFWVSAAQLREDLVELRQNIDPHRQHVMFDQMVLVGHSMGGLVAKMQTVHSGNDFWSIVSDRPFEELSINEEDRQSLAQTLFFEPNPSVRRVVSIGTPHRGSDFANEYTRWLGRKFITLPSVMVQLAQNLVRNNPGFFKNTELLTINTSIDSLAPDSPLLPALLNARRAEWVKYHNIVGVVSENGLLARLSGESDGVVAFASAHLEDVESEIVVEADHVTVHQHPRAVLEVRRILLQHQQEVESQHASRGIDSKPVGYWEPAPILRPNQVQTPSAPSRVPIRVTAP